uniref:ABC1 atypical kinase-like domain-containing protein n=1 Tax=Globisporangium ultimum (strain ATCC 200006 / CBS 805.95 / DAOM BR144) TaxID=431595 RepID=K3W889_GLOUD
MAASTARRRVVATLSSAAVLAGGTYVVDEANANILSRSARVVVLGVNVVADFRQNLKGTPRESPEYKTKLQALNMRIAHRLLDVCFHNGGIYTKFGQQLATFNHGLPKEFTETLAELQDRAKPASFAQAKKTIESELQKPWQELFAEIDETPIAAASLAQVHRAVDKQGRTVAVKVQYPHLALQMKADLRVMKWAAQLTEYYFPDVQIQWLFPEFESALRSELDFENEKQNSRRIADHLKHNSNVHVPIVYDELSAKRVLTMEFIEAPKISQIDEIKKLGLDPTHVARVLCEVFGEMVFCHGFVHCDPHPGNIFVRQNPNPKAKNKEQLVLLDHGLYRELDDDFRKTYCDLWRAMLLRDTALLEDCSKRLNVGAFAKYLPLLFTYRTISSTTPLASSMTEGEKKELTEDLKKLQFSSVTDFLEQLPRDMLFVFRTNNMIRSLNKDLGGSSRERFSVMGKYAVEGHASFYSNASQHQPTTLLGTCKYWVDHFNMLFHIHVVDFALGVFQKIYGKEPLKMKNAG